MPAEPLFDKDLIAVNRRRAETMALPGADFLLRAVAGDLAERLSVIQRKFQSPVIVEPPAGNAKETVCRATGLPLEDVSVLQCQAEVDAAAGRHDLAISLLSLQAIDDIPAALSSIRKTLQPDGLFMGAMLGAGTLGELRECLISAEAEIHSGASARVIPFADVRDSGALLQRSGFALPVADVETITVRHATLFGLMTDLRAMGAANPLLKRSRRPATRGLFARAAQIYSQRFSDPDGRIRSTFNVIWLSGWAPHESQQKPLRPGSAKASLKDVL